jgi:magnesium chelatase subunit I
MQRLAARQRHLRRQRVPDLAGKIRSAFNIQKATSDWRHPIRPARRDAVLPEPRLHRARKIITPQDHRTEIRTPSVDARQRDAITSRKRPTAALGSRVEIPGYVWEVAEEIAFQARADRKVDKRSGVSQRLPITTLELVVSNAERRALANREGLVVPRVTDIYAALPSITGKFELEYEGELRGAETVARDLIRSAVGTVFTGVFDGVDTRTVVEWFDLGGTLQLGDNSSADDVIAQTRGVQGLRELADRLVW